MTCPAFQELGECPLNGFLIDLMVKNVRLRKHSKYLEEQLAGAQDQIREMLIDLKKK